MKMTLLELTQSVLSSLNSDEVNSITDTTESVQVTDIIKTCYYNIISRSDMPEHRELFQLDASGDNDLPVTMTKPDRISKIDWIKYFKYDGDATSSDSYSYITILPVTQFLDMVNQLNTNEAYVGSFVFTDQANTFTFNFRNDLQPTYCTVISNYWIIFDSYDSSIDTTLQEDKTLCFGRVIPTFTISDSFIPDLDDEKFSLLLNEAKSLAYFELKQAQHPKAEQEAKRQWNNLQKNKSLVDKPSYFDQLPYFGRK